MGTFSPLLGNYPLPPDQMARAFLFSRLTMSETITLPPIKKSITTVNEWVRYAFGITRDEYALCSYIQFRSADPRNKLPGWCSDHKEEVAVFVGISRPGLYKMLDRMVNLGLLEVDPATGYARITALWMDTEQNCKLSLHEEDAEKRKLSLQSSVNKVYTERKLSLQARVNKVTRIKEYDIRERELDIQEDAETATGGEDYEVIEVKSEEEIDKAFTGRPARKKKDKAGPYLPRDVANFLELPIQNFFTEILKNGSWADYRAHRSEIRKGWYASARSESLAVEELFGYCNGNPDFAQTIVNQSRAKKWHGLHKFSGVLNGKQQPTFATKQDELARAVIAGGADRWDS